ncbi:MAG: glycine zipper domain-containing protein [Burkholderiales bacterium]
MDTETTDKLMSDLKAVVRDAEALISAAAGAAGERLNETGAVARDEAREAAREIEAQVRDHPWAAIGIAAGVGLVLGLLLGRK